MSIHGCTLAEYTEMYSKIRLDDVKYLGFRDVPDLLRKYTEGDQALDYGCGPGKSSAFLRKYGFQVDGVDINENSLKLARQTVADARFQVVLNGTIPAPDGCYDLVFCSWVLQDIGPKDQLVATFSEISRVLRAGGTFMAIVPSAAMYGRDWSSLDARFEENANLKSGDRVKYVFKENNFVLRSYFWTDDDYREALRAAGFDVVLTHSPLGKDDEGFAWINEKEIAMFTIYVAKNKRIACDVDGKFEN